MSASDHDFLVNEDLPPRQRIAALCQQAGYQCRGMPLHKQPDGPIIAWVKFGLTVTTAEAKTQDWVAQALQADPEACVRVPRIFDAFTTVPHPFFTVGHIVMEYIDAPDCQESDVELAAKAVERLIRAPAPVSAAPGPVGGGQAIHTFFHGWESDITYQTLEELEAHVNGILRLKGDSRRVDFEADASKGLVLCPCDIHPGNFKKIGDRVVALDSRATCFMPPAFLAFAMEAPVNNFAFQVAQRVRYPPSANVSPMLSASYFLVPHGTNEIGQPNSFSFDLS
ncbi:hypothetical protein BOTBODRAFT_458903 [Botryobasidium botryosum FD-172 SS1]|uniref:Aminoglycoside phosphotransferase domain-containing protein n=1 Tax=Botryobasidium botryosum (strain FD-172 SS1) TaxID=930990 RepID=A0A067M9K5_BOTB1|nr:hypothetical protein BOTBODRAFT_458903 [Botryobasidium botryosum FD-172 SS1]